MKYAIYICCVSVICASLANCVQPIATQCFATILPYPRSTEMKVVHSPFVRAAEIREGTDIIYIYIYIYMEDAKYIHLYIYNDLALMACRHIITVIVG